MKINEKVSLNIASEASYIFIFKCLKMVNLASFWNPEACSQTVLPDMLISIEQLLVENAKIKNSNVTFWVIFKRFDEFFSQKI